MSGALKKQVESDPYLLCLRCRSIIIRLMRPAFWITIALLASSAAPGWGAEEDRPEYPQFKANGQLALPQDYREWVYLSSGLGMTYGLGASSDLEHANFDNVFVTRRAYQAFRDTGVWPDKTMFILEARSAHTKGSINEAGRYQGNVVAIEGEVKNEADPLGKWTFFSFDPAKATGTPLPRTAACYSCHAQHGAVDNTFVQFYPTLLSIALQKGVVKPGALTDKP